MVFGTLLKLSVLVFGLILVSACGYGYIKDMKEKVNSPEAPVNVRTEEPASPTDGKVNPEDESSKKNGNSASMGNDSHSVSYEKSKELSKNDLNPDQSTNKEFPSKGSTN
jgi:hypothetical protein